MYRLYPSHEDFYLLQDGLSVPTTDLPSTEDPEEEEGLFYAARRRPSRESHVPAATIAGAPYNRVQDS